MRKKIQRSIKDYEDILKKPRHISRDREKMPTADRAAQFSPFSAVVGHEAAVKEAARYTDSKKLLDEMEKAAIDEKLGQIELSIKEQPEVELTYFLQDRNSTKAGGEYLTKIGKIKKLDSFSHEIVFLDEARIAFDDIYSVDFI